MKRILTIDSSFLYSYISRTSSVIIPSTVRDYLSDSTMGSASMYVFVIWVPNESPELMLCAVVRTHRPPFHHLRRPHYAHPVLDLPTSGSTLRRSQLSPSLHFRLSHFIRTHAIHRPFTNQFHAPTRYISRYGYQGLRRCLCLPM